MTISTVQASSNVVQSLMELNDSVVPNHATVFCHNTYPHTMILNSLYSDYQAQMHYFGRALKEMNYTVEAVSLVISGTLPSHFRIRPVCIVLSMTRNGECLQVVYDLKSKEVIESDNISQEDKDICAVLFVAQGLYQPEIEQASKWN